MFYIIEWNVSTFVEYEIVNHTHTQEIKNASHVHQKHIA